MNFIKFLGTAGARFVMLTQLRASGGIWVSYQNTNLLIDPGPGALVRALSSRPKLSPSTLDAIILTHKHLDHSSDINVMIEAMTHGCKNKRGVLFVPNDALGQDGVIFSYLVDKVAKIEILKPGNFSVENIRFQVPTQNVHSVETYGLKFLINEDIISFVSDTKFFPGLVDLYKGSTTLILNVVFLTERSEYDHLSIDQAVEIVRQVNPKKVIFTHFGIEMVKNKLHKLEKQARKQVKSKVVFAYDGMTIKI